MPSTGDVVSIGVSNSFTYQPTISSTPAGTLASITIGNKAAATLTIASGATLNVSSISLTSTSVLAQVAVNGVLDVDNITMSSTTYNKITMGSTSILYLSGNITGGTLVPSSASTSSIILNGTANTQSFGTGNFAISGNIGVLDIYNNYNSSSTSRGVTLTGATVNHVIVEPGAIFNANGSLVEGTNYYATIGVNSLYISRSTFNLHANDNIDVTSTLQFTAVNQVINLYPPNSSGTNICPNVLFTGTTITINSGTSPYTTSNFQIRGNLDITSTTSAITYNGISQINIGGNFTGTTALQCGSIPVNIGGSWTNSGAETMTGVVTYNGTTSSSTQTVATNVTYANNLVFTGASPKKIASGTLTIGGNLDNSAGCSVDYVSNKTTTLMNGTAAQSILSGTATNSIYSTDPVYGSVFYNLTIGTSGSTTANKTTTLSGYNNIAPGGVLSMTTAGGVLDATGTLALTLMSTSAGSAAVADLTNNGANTGSNMPLILGTVYVQRFITGGGSSTYRAYRLLSSPVNITSNAASTSTTLSNLISLSYLKGYTLSGGQQMVGAFIAGTGGTSGGFSAYNANPTVYFYNEKLVTNNKTFISGKNLGINSMSGSSFVLSDGNTYTIPVGNGFIMYYVGPSSRVSGSASINPTDGLLTANGYLNQGTVTVNLWYTPANSTAGHLSYNTPTLSASAAGFNLIGNPYACSIDLSKVMSDNTGIDAVYLLNDRNPNQAYTAYTSAGTSAPSSGYVMSGQGFMVHAKTTGQTLTFQETEKVPSTQLTGSALVLAAHTSLTSDQSKALQSSAPLTGLYMKLQKDSATYSYCGIYYNKSWSAAYEAGDAIDMNSATAAACMSSFSSDGIRLAVNHLPDYTQQARTAVKLYTSATAAGLYQLSAEGIRGIDTADYSIYLIDNYKKDSLDIGRYGTYNFNITSDTLSYGANRFVLALERKPLPPYQLISFTGAKAPQGVQLTWKAFNAGDYTTFSLERRDAQGNFNALYNKQSDGSTVYTYTDVNPQTGTNTYRLKQSDINNQITYSQLVNVIYTQPSQQVGSSSGLSLYPNPARQSIQITILQPDSSAVQQAGSYTTIIFDASGIVKMRKSTSGTFTWNTEVSNLYPGAYTAEVFDNKGQLSGQAKFIKIQ